MILALSDTGTVLISLGGAIIVSIIAPLVVGRVAAKSREHEAEIRRNERAEDNARQDEIARRLIESNDKIAAEATAAALNQSVIRHDLTAVRDLGRVTHALVNSDKTAGMQRQRMSFIAQRAALNGQLRLAEQLARANSDIITAEVQSSLDVIAEQVNVLTLEIDTLTAEIAARVADQHTAEASVAVSKDVVVSVQAVPPA